MTQYNFTVDHGLTLNDANITAVLTPDNPSAINFVGNSSGDGSGYSTMQLVPDETLTGNDQYLIIDPTGGGHIHIRAGGTQDSSNGSLYLGGENSYVQLPAGSNPNVLIAANTHVWTFGNDSAGNLTIPTNGAIKTAPGSDGNIYLHPDGNGQVIIQGSTTTLLVLAGDTPDTTNRFEIDTYGANLNGFGGGTFVGTYRRTNGPTQVDDRLAAFVGKGTEDGVTLTANSSVRVTLDAAGNWSTGNTPTHISFWTTPFGANVVSESVRISPMGNLVLYSGNAIVGNGYVKTGTFTAATLPDGATQGARAFVSDADSRTWGNLVVGGAGNAVPVWSDGSNWYIG